MDFDKFIKECEKGYCLRNTLISKNCLKRYKQESCYKKYQKQADKENQKIQEEFEKEFDYDVEVENAKDDKWELVRHNIRWRDNNECQLLKKLTEPTRQLFNTKANPSLINELDPAHYLSRGSYPDYKYLEDNIILLNRQSHSWLDTMCSPVTGKSISKAEWHWWWEFILGQERKHKLDKLRSA